MGVNVRFPLTFLVQRGFKDLENKVGKFMVQRGFKDLGNKVGKFMFFDESSLMWEDKWITKILVTIDICNGIAPKIENFKNNSFIQSLNYWTFSLRCSLCQLTCHLKHFC